MTNFESLSALVVAWATERRIIPNAKPHSQLLKAVSEMGELADAENCWPVACCRSSLE